MNSAEQILLSIYSPAGESDFDTHLSTSKIIDLLWDNFSIEISHEDLTEILHRHKFIFVQLSNPLEFEWLMKSQPSLVLCRNMM
jgi:hypothetical protein